MSESFNESDGSDNSSNRVTVVIPNWNGIELLGPCLESLDRQEFQDFEVIVADNGSTDGSVPFLQSRFPQARIIRLDQNRGFSAAVNAGIAASRSPYIALLNNDTEVHPLWLQELVKALDEALEAGSAASKILFFSDRRTVNSAGDEFSFFGVAYQRRLRQGDSDFFDEPRYVFSACGAAALYRKELFENVGLFDESFFAYHEDVDLGFRAQLAGYRCLFVPSAIVYHKHQMTTSRVPGLWAYLHQRNKYFVIIKNLPTPLLLLCFPLILAHELISLAKAARKGYLRPYFKAFRDIAAQLPLLLQTRRAIQAERVADNASIRRSMHLLDPLRPTVYRLAGALSGKR